MRQGWFMEAGGGFANNYTRQGRKTTVKCILVKVNVNSFSLIIVVIKLNQMLLECGWFLAKATLLSLRSYHDHVSNYITFNFNH